MILMTLMVLDMAESTSIEAMILKSRLPWAEHVIRMEGNRLPKQPMFGKLASGKRKQGGPPKRFKDCVKASISHAKITPKELGWTASPHQTRHGHIRGEAPHTDRGEPGKKKGVG